MPKLKLSNKTDLLTIYQLAKEIWYENYLTIITAEQIEYMLDKFYNSNALEKLMNEGQMICVWEYEKQIHAAIFDM